MTFVKINDERSHIGLSMDQRPILNIDFRDVVGVHYDKYAECTNLILKNDSIIAFKGFCEKDLVLLKNSIQYCLKDYRGKDRYKYTTNGEIEI